MSQQGDTWKYPFGSVYFRLTKTGIKRWYIYYRNEGERKRECVKGAQSRADALKVLQVRVTDSFRVKHGFKSERKKISFSDFAEMYLLSYAKVNKRSWKTDEYLLRRLKSTFKGKEIHEVNSLMIENFRSSILSDGAAKSTANRYVALLKVMFNRAIDWNYLDSNPAKKVKLFSETENLRERILSFDDEEALIGVASGHLRSMIIVGLNTGMRRNEILKLKWEQVDFVMMLVKVENTKSGKPRIIPVNRRLFIELDGLKRKNGISSFVFLNPKTGLPFTDVKKAFHSAVKQAKIGSLRFHDLRHTFASRLVAAGVDLITVKELLGHHSVRVTERYTH